MTDDLDLTAAARELNVGVDYVEVLVAKGKLASVAVGNGRRVRRDDLLAFKVARDAERREGLRELTRLTEEFGGYDREPSG